MITCVRLVARRPLVHLDAQRDAGAVHAVLPVLDAMMLVALVLDCSETPTALERLPWVLPQVRRAPPHLPPVRPTLWKYSDPQDPLVAVLGRVAAAVSIGLAFTNQHVLCMP